MDWIVVIKRHYLITNDYILSQFLIDTILIYSVVLTYRVKNNNNGC